MAQSVKLSIDEVICLQMAGVSTTDIVRMDLAAFDSLFGDNPEYEDYLSKANDMLDRQESLGITAISVQDTDFPRRLQEIGDDCPAVIYCLGNVEMLKKKQAVAIIGARVCDKEGYKAAFNVAEKYAKGGNVIVSGLALGCDTAAHRGALAVNGETIAVVATGLDRIHPRESETLQREILSASGLIVSEQPLGIKANPTRLVARNRIQAALSDSVILAQCPAKSGSLHTMRFARRYGKPCYAVTYPTRTPANAGNYLLLDTGQAKPIFLEDVSR